MPLPMFNSQGTGPQGIGGIPPETIREGLSSVDPAIRPTATLQPEDYPGPQAVLDRQVDTILGPAGGPSSAAGTSGQVNPATQNGPATAPQAPASAGTAQAASPPAGVPDDRLRGIFDKYGGDVNRILESYVNMQGAYTRSQQQNQSMEARVAEMQRMMEDMGAQIAALATPPAPQGIDPFGTTPAGAGPAYRTPAAAGNGTTSQHGQYGQTEPNGQQDFLVNPEPLLESVIDRVVKRNLIAVEQAREKKSEADRFNDNWNRRQAEIGRLRPIMARLYNARRDLYDAMPPNQMLDALIEHASDREMAHTAAKVLSDLRDGGYIQSGPVNPGVPAGASPPLGPGSARPPGGQPGAAPPGGNWSDTRAMQDLWRTRDGSVDESRNVMKVLKERGFGEDVPLF